MSTLAQQIETARRGMLVRRYHQRYTAEPDTVGKHSCGVALFCLMIDPGCGAQVLAGAITHDLAEYIVGDLPAPTKRTLSDEARAEIDLLETKVLNEAGFNFVVTKQEKMLLKVADYLDGIYFCIEERSRGNSGLEQVGETYLSYLHDLIAHARIDPLITWSLKAQSIFNHAISVWRNHGK